MSRPPLEPPDGMLDGTLPSVSIFSANLLYLVTMLLMAVVGSAAQSVEFTWGLIGSEALLVLLPSILYLRRLRLPLRVGMRLVPVTPPVAFVCLLLGVATFVLGAATDTLLPQLVGGLGGSAISVPGGAYPVALYFIAVALVAPVCEEPLFRGVIQGAYEQRRSSGFAITMVALMFVLFHFRLAGLLGLTIAALVLGFVAWQTRSIFASVSTHVGLNTAAAVRLLVAAGGRQEAPSPSLLSATLALFAITVCILVLGRLHGQVDERRSPDVDERRSPDVDERRSPDVDESRSWLWTYSPLVGAAAVYAGVVASGLVAAVTTGQITLEEAGYDPVHVTQVLESRYVVTDRAGRDIGAVTCAIGPAVSQVTLECAGDLGHGAAEDGSEGTESTAYAVRWSAAWDADTLGLSAFSFSRVYRDSTHHVAVVLKSGRLVVDDDAGVHAVALSPGDLVEYEWAWRVNALRPQFVTAIRAPFARFLPHDAQSSAPYPTLAPEVLRLRRSEAIEVPAGVFSASSAAVGGQEAWYAKDHAGPVMFDDGELTYRLTR